jgi:hypothetical protein
MPAGRPTELGLILFEMIDGLKKKERAQRVLRYIKEFNKETANCPFCGVNHLAEEHGNNG